MHTLLAGITGILMTLSSFLGIGQAIPTPAAVAQGTPTTTKTVSTTTLPLGAAHLMSQRAQRVAGAVMILAGLCLLAEQLPR